MSKKITLRYCTTPANTLYDQYKTLRNKIFKNTLTEEDVAGFPLDYSPKNATLFITMISKNESCWTLAEYYIICNRTQPPEYLYLTMDQHHNSVFMTKGHLCFKREVECPLTLSILLTSITKGKTIIF
jgi:hypothetical protein